MRVFWVRPSTKPFLAFPEGTLKGVFQSNTCVASLSPIIVFFNSQQRANHTKKRVKSLAFIVNYFLVIYHLSEWFKILFFVLLFSSPKEKIRVCNIS